RPSDGCHPRIGFPYHMRDFRVGLECQKTRVRSKIQKDSDRFTRLITYVINMTNSMTKGLKMCVK
ncbi:hypothetical protein L9F63_024130, partial [Diploptera punctata]